jgi:hemerythrin-like domain-containing protein
MSDTLLLLGFEHQSFGELLSLIDEEIRNLETGSPVDIGLLQSVAAYFSDYPDECHHPVEELVLRRLCMRDSDAVPDPDKLSKDHLEIARITKLFATTLGAAASNGDGRTPALGKIMKEFVERYRNHMSMEEEHFFPAAAKALTKEDWAEIDFSVFDRDDPLYNSSTEARFESLRKKMEKSANEFSTPSFGLTQTKRLQRLVSISDFNKSMHDQDGHLVRHPQGGYGLVLDGRIAVDIPECDEQQAVWCAYYFLQGQATRGMHGHNGAASNVD